MRKRNFILITGLAVTAALSLGYFSYRPEAEERPQRPAITPERQPITREDAVVEYIYIYDGDGIKEVTLVPIPPYLTELTQSEVTDRAAGFELAFFSPEKLTLKKTLSGNSRQHYYLGERDGYLAVYYKKGGGLKEMTNTPISSLSEDEKSMLMTTEIVGKDKLARVLEDMES